MALLFARRQVSHRSITTHCRPLSFLNHSPVHDGLCSVQCRYLRGTPGPSGTAPLVCVAAARCGGRLIVAAALAEAGSSSSSAVAAAAAPDPAVQRLLAASLQQHPRLEVGHLPNGLRYVVLPNAAPPQRLEAHLEIHAGSVDEGEAEQASTRPCRCHTCLVAVLRRPPLLARPLVRPLHSCRHANMRTCPPCCLQGVAHLVEHVTFLGSKKREGLLGTGARSNAYTDFHHTVFHVHSPERNGNTGQLMLPQVGGPPAPDEQQRQTSPLPLLAFTWRGPLWPPRHSDTAAGAQVLDALTEIAFEPEFLPSRIEKERKAVVAESQVRLEAKERLLVPTGAC